MTVAQLPKLTPKGKQALDKLLQERVDGHNIPATFFGATTREGPIYWAFRGEKIYDRPEHGHVNEDTTLQLFSSTKFITTLACLQLVDKGLIELDDPAVIEKYCPELIAQPILEGFTDDGKEILEKRTKPITLKRLLSHSSGVAYSFTSPLLDRWQKEHNVPSFFSANVGVESITGPLVFQPGSGWKYSMGIDWAGVVVERVTGLKLEDYFRKHIFEPCGIKSFTFYPTEDVKQKLMGNTKRADDGTLIPFKPVGYQKREWDPEKIAFNSGGGGLFGTARDYLRLLQNVLDVKTSSTPLISPKSFDELFTNALPPHGTDNTCYSDLADMMEKQTYHDPAHLTNGTGHLVGHSVGLCLNLADSCHGRKEGSGCWDGAAKTQYWLDPKTGLAGIAFTQIMTTVPGDPFFRVYNEFERTLYDGLE